MKLRDLPYKHPLSAGVHVEQMHWDTSRMEEGNTDSEINLRVAMEGSIRSRWDTLEGPLRGDRQGDGHVTDREAYFLTRLTFHKL